jgi:hypothetical protein
LPTDREKRLRKARRIAAVATILGIGGFFALLVAESRIPEVLSDTDIATQEQRLSAARESLEGLSPEGRVRAIESAIRSTKATRSLERSFRRLFRVQSQWVLGLGVLAASIWWLLRPPAPPAA